MRQVALLVLLAACKQGAGDDYPIQPPGPIIDPKPPVVDAATDGNGNTDAVVDAVVGMAGRVCLLADARAETTCKATGAGGFHVAIGTETATTTDSGAFVIPNPTGTNLVWHVTGTNLQPSVMPFGTDNTIPAMLAATYLDLEAQNGASVQDANEGEIFVRVVKAGMPLANARAGSAPQSVYGPLYDTASAIAWGAGTSSATGAAGVAWFPGIAVGAATLSITPMGGALIAIPDVPVESQAITWIVVAAP